MAISLNNISIDRIRWTMFDISSNKKMPQLDIPCKSGVYCIYSKGLLVYIGCSGFLPSRMQKSHKIIRQLRNGSTIPPDDVYMTYHVTKRYREIERILIHQNKPSLNGCIPNMKNARYVSSENHHPCLDYIFKYK